jgi:hypothetical protein
MAKIDKSLYTKEQYRALKAKAKAANLQLTPTIEQQTTPAIPPNTAFVLGNGTSRSHISPEHLKNIGKVYGCNALYRSFSPDYLVAVDSKMVIEINNNGYQRKNQVWTNPNKLFARMEGFNLFQPSKGWSSGPTALWLASQHKYTTIYILGFDYQGTNGGKQFNNIYADTDNYKRSDDTATYYGNWLRQTKNVIEENTNIQYIRVIAADNFIPSELNNIVNLKHIIVDTFEKMYSHS